MLSAAPGSVRDTALGGVRTTPSGSGKALSRSVRYSRTAREASSQGNPSALGVHRARLASARTKLPSTATWSAAASPRLEAPLDDALEHLSHQPAVAEAPMAVLGEGGVVGHLPLKAEPAEPAVGEVQIHLLAQSPLGTDAEEVAHQQHAHHEFGGDRGPPRGAVVLSHVPAHP